MNRKYYLVLAIILFSVGIILTYLYFLGDDKQDKKTYWAYEIDSDSNCQTFYCAPNQTYTFDSKFGFNRIEIKNQLFEKPYYRIPNSFLISFDEPTFITVNCSLDGIWFKRGILEIWEGEKFNCPRLLYLTPDRYSNCSFNVQRGMSCDVPMQKEVYFLGDFKNGVLKQEIFVPSGEEKSFNFWDSYKITFKSGEVPFIMVMKDEPHFKTLTINGIEKPRAYFLDEGDIIQTDIWLNRDDRISFDKQYNSFGVWLVQTNRLLFASGNSAWGKLKGFSDKYYFAPKDGYLRIKCLKKTILTHINIGRIGYGVPLQTGQSRQFKVFQGDVFSIQSQTRFYLDGKLMDPNLPYIYTADKDGYITFKGSINPYDVNITTLRRRGY